MKDPRVQQQAAPIWAWLVPLLLIVLPYAIGFATSPSWFRRVCEEDGPIEWATVTALVLAAVSYARRFVAKRRIEKRPLFVLGLAAFCVFFAGEEISWGQRLFTVQPPEYFLAENSQQELNLHNLLKSFVQTKTVVAVLWCLWGALAALALYLRRSRPTHGRAASLWKLMSRFGASPASFVALSGAASLVVILVYPWPYTGEVVECAFGLTLLLDALLSKDELALSPSSTGKRRSLQVLAVVITVAAGSVLMPKAMDFIAQRDAPERRERAQREVEMLAQDWLSELDRSGRIASGCGTHLRVYTWVSRRVVPVATGAFAGGVSDELRRQYFLDPWNNPYWIEHRCSGGDQQVDFYSFGPNRRRDRRGGDDVHGRVVPDRSPQ